MGSRPACCALTAQCLGSAATNSLYCTPLLASVRRTNAVCMYSRIRSPPEQRSEKQYGGRLRTPRSARYPTPPTRRRDVDKAKISITARKMERGGGLEVSRRAASTAYSTHPLINPAPVSLMDRLAANMFLTKHRDDLAPWQDVQLGPEAAAS